MILPSILAANFATLQNTIIDLEKEGVEALHFDVMDNHFVPNLTFGYKFIQDLREFSSLTFDVHLMINDPLKNIPLYIEAGADIITCHEEAFHNSEEIFKASELCRQNDVKFGLSIKPNTLVEKFLPYLNIIDLALIMSVEPGFGGQSFLPNAFAKIEFLDSEREKQNLSFIIEVDGGVNAEHMPELIEKGTDYLVMGTAFFKEKDVRNLIFLRQDLLKKRGENGY